MPASLEEQIKVKLVETLKLSVAPEKIENTTPLFRDGLGLDSVDALEIAAMLSMDFNVEVPDGDTAKEIFVNVKTLADFVRKNQPA